MKDYQLKDAEFMTAKEKRLTLKAWDTFLKHGCKAEHFTDRLYKHLTLHCSFIAHYDRGGFYATYFENPEDTAHFLTQFDPSGPCNSIEYGGNYWIGPSSRNDMGDINGAMIEIAGQYISALSKTLKAGAVVNAENELRAAQAKLEALRK